MMDDILGILVLGVIIGALGRNEKLKERKKKGFLRTEVFSPIGIATFVACIVLAILLISITKP